MLRSSIILFRGNVKAMICSVFALISMALSANADMIYTYVHEHMYSDLAPKEFNVDLNKDSVDDLSFSIYHGSFGVAPLNDNSITLSANGVAAFSVDTSIGTDAPPESYWSTYGNIINESDVGIYGGIDFSGEYFSTCAYFGIKLLIEEESYYGWVQIYNPEDVISGGWIMDYAVETEPDTSIMTTPSFPASVVPEPGTGVISFFGLCCLWFVRERKLFSSYKC